MGNILQYTVRWASSKYIIVFPEYFGKINTKITEQKYKYIKSAVTCSKTVVWHLFLQYYSSESIELSKYAIKSYF